MKRFSTVAAVAAPVVALGLAAAIAGPSFATASSTGAASAGSTATGSSSAVAVSAESTSPDGSLSLVLTSPRSVNRSHSATVSCATAGATYHASAKAYLRSVPVRVTVSVPSYDGPGTYTASNVVVTAPGLTVDRTPRSSVVLTSTGGSYTFSRTGPWGRTVAGTASWTCSS